MVDPKTVLFVGLVGGLVLTGSVVAMGVDASGPESFTPSDLAEWGGTALSADAGGGETQETDGPTEPSYTVQDARFPGWVRTGERLEASVSIASDAETATERTVRLRVDEDLDGTFERTVATRRVEVPADGTTNVGFAVGPLAPGQVRYGVSIGEHVATAWDVTVLQRPVFRLGSIDGPESVLRGENATVTVPVSNGGDYGSVADVRVSGQGATSAPVHPFDTVETGRVVLGPGEETRVTVTLPTADLGPGSHSYVIETEDSSRRGTLEVLQPATFELSGPHGSVNVTRGETANVTVTVENTGDVAGSQVVTFVDPTDTVQTRTVHLDGGESTTVTFAVPTADLSRGSYDYEVATADDDIRPADDGAQSAVPVRVREAYFEVSSLRGNETLVVGEKMTFAADVTNTGNATATQTVAFTLDLDGDDRPEGHGIVRNVTLDPGNETTVRFWIPYLEDPDPLNQVEDLPYGTYMYGIHSEDDAATSVFDARGQPYAAGGGGGSDDDVEPLSASLDEISQAKYGYFYHELSAETQSQIEEIHARQPFTEGRGITDVLTREEIARQEYDLDVERGDDFRLQDLDVETQQRIEADFDAQFERDAGDRVESWDEIARNEYGSDYDELTEARRETVRDRYWEQFE